MTTEPQTFIFEDSDEGRGSFFRLQCKYGDTQIEIGKGMTALVLDPRQEFPEIKAPIKIEPDGKQLALIKVVSEDGGFIVTASTPSSNGERLAPGDFVVWVPFAYANIDSVADKRMGWAGLIRAKINWRAVGTSGPFELICHYD